MNRPRTFARAAFATGMIGLGVVGLVFGDFDDVWQSAPVALPGHHVLAYASAVLMLICGLGLLWTRTEAPAVRVLFPYLAFLVVVLKLPVVVRTPLVEGAWQSMSEILVLLAGAWVLFARDTRAGRPAQVLFGFALIPLGLAHFVYLSLTAPLVPAWLPYHTGWAYLTGAAQIAAGLGVLFGICPGLAATLEGTMLTAFTALIWVPTVLASPTSRPSWSELTISWAVSAGAWVVAASLAKERSGPTIPGE